MRRRAGRRAPVGALTHPSARSGFSQDALAALEVGDDPCNGAPGCTVYGYLSVSRLTFALAVYHLLLSGATVGVSSSRHPRAQLHNRSAPRRPARGPVAV